MKTVLSLLSSLMPFGRGRAAVAGAEAVHTAPPDSPANSHAPARLGASSAAADGQGSTDSPDHEQHLGQSLTFAAPTVPERLGPHSPRTLDELLAGYREVRRKAGVEAETLIGMKNLGHYWMVRQAESHFGLRWREFKLLAGFHDYPDTPDSAFLREHARRFFKIIRTRKGDAALRPEWLSSQGLDCFVRLVTLRLKMPWASFLAHCGVQSVATESPPPPLQARIIPPSCAVDARPGPAPLGKKTVVRIDEVHRTHTEILTTYGVDAALNTTWLQENGHGDIYYSGRNVFGLGWSRHLVSLGAYLAKNRPDLLAKVEGAGTATVESGSPAHKDKAA